jgi:hypothetical protein
MKKILILIIISFACTSKRNLQKDCILKDPKYKQFVDDHQLKEDIDTFLKN